MIDKISPGEIEKLKTIFNIKLPTIETPNKNEKPENPKKPEPVELKPHPIAISIATNDLQINFPIACFDTDLFSDIEAKFYKEYPNLNDENNFFLVSGTQIERCKTLIQNGIKNHDKIIIITKNLNNYKK